MGTVLRIFTFLLLCAPALSFALGLGNIALKSNLGEPLQATIPITDAESIPELSCFSVTDISDTPAFKKSNISLKSVDGNYQLNINTTNVISTPIINLRISVNCKPNLNREYLLLLDPGSLPSSQNTVAITTTKQATNQVITNADHLPIKSKTQVHQTPSPSETGGSTNSLKKNTISRKMMKNRKSDAKTSADKRLMESYTGKQADDNLIKPTNHNRPTAQTTSSANKTQLIISGRNINLAKGEKNSSLSLRFDTEIDLSKAGLTTPLNTADTLDEVTVMTNRLTHLEKQIVGLQDKNASLRLEAEKAKNSSLLSNQASNFLTNLSVALAIVAALAGVVWLRRKMFSNRILNEETNWFNSDDSLENEPLNKNNSPNADTTAFDTINFNQSAGNHDLSDQDHSNSFNYPSTFTVNDNDVSESVLDHAEVFIAHDRPAMAIQLLQNHLMDSPVESPEIWLKLISLLATEGTEAEYDNAVIACKQFFNIKLPSFAEASSIDESTIEDYPHILARLQDVWGSEFAVEFLNDLIFNRQSQPREGFGRSTFEELFFLDQIANSLHSSSKFQKRNNSSESAKNLPPLEIESAEKIMQDYGITSSDLEPQNKRKTPPSPPKTNNTQDDPFTAESFTQDQISDIKNDGAVKSSAFDLSMPEHPLEQTEKPNEIIAPLNTDARIHKSFDEIDFSGAIDEINIEAPTDTAETNVRLSKSDLAEVSFPEIEFTIEHHALVNEVTLADKSLDFTLDFPENPTEKNTKQTSNIETLNLPDMIEWESPESTSKRKTKSKPKT